MRIFIILLTQEDIGKNVASKYQQQFKVQMQQRKRLLKANRRPLDSFDQAAPINTSESNVLSSIQNQNLYLKLVGIALEMSRQAGVSESILSEVEQKLLNAKGLSQYSMLNQEKNKIMNKVREQAKQQTYNLSKKYIDRQQQLSFLNQMEKQVEQVEAKQHIIYALKKYIEQKKKSIGNEMIKPDNMTRVKYFIQKIKNRTGENKIRRSHFYGQTLREIIGRISPVKCRAYQTIRKMVHLKTLWGHTFFSQAEEQYCPVYNVIFDNSQKLILTGGQDGKLKVWSRQTGALVSTLQGHKDYINKICVSKNNKLLFSAAQDGVRFFDLDTMASMGGYSIDCIMEIGQVVSSTTQKSSVIFANNKKLYVLPFQTIISQRNRKLQPYDFKIYNFGSKIHESTVNTMTLTINPQGIVFLGFTQGQILIFDFNKLEFAEIDEENFSQTEQIQKIPQFVLPIICVLNAHEGDILEIKWNPVLSCFSTGAKKDGVCKIWQFKGTPQISRPIVIKQLKIPKYKMKRKKKVYNCNFCCWNSSFTHITCSFEQQQLQEQNQNRGDGEVIVYNSIRNQVTWEMSKTIDLSSIRAMDAHPFYSNIMVICDSYGKIMLTDIYQNYIINIFQQRAFHLNHPSFCLVITECRFSQDGLNLLVATQYGNISIYGYDVKDFYHLYPTQQFFANDYQEFYIDPKTFKPVLDLNAPVDINLLNRGDLENIRHQSYSNLVTINPKQLRKLIENPTSKLSHQNCTQISQSQVRRISEWYLDHERNLEILKQNIQQIQGKRMTILFEERQSRQLKLRQVIQEKLQKIKQIDQGISLNLVNNSFSAAKNYSSGAFSQIQHNLNSGQGEQNQLRRRGRRVTRSNDHPLNSRISNIPHYNMEDSQQNNGQNQNRQNLYEEQEEYQAEGEVSDDQQMQSQNGQGDDQDFDEDNQSDEILPNGRSRRKRNISTRRNHIPERRPIRNLRRRPANVQIQELQHEYQQYGRIRKRAVQQANQEAVEDQHQEEARKQIRKAANRGLTQMRQQRQLCQLCQTRDATVLCSDCRFKRYCDHCKSSRGKKINQNSAFACFQCFYLQNTQPQMYKNVSFQKYVLPLRTDLFVPQIGDEVAYFFQGYQQFLYDKIQILNNKYKDLQIYFEIVPHENHPQLTRIQKCTIIDINYAFPLQESTTSQLSYHQSKRGARGRTFKSNIQDILTLLTLRAQSGLQFKVFHSPGYEYLLKWQIYDDIITNDRYGKFKLFDVVKIKDEQIQIMEIRALNSSYSKSIWKNIIVHKAESKYLRRTRDKNDDIAINIWNIDGFIDPKAFEYESSFNATAREHYRKQIQKIQHKEQALWDIFSEFVDPEQYPTYNQYVETSMCLKLILERLQNNYYVSEQSFMKDVKMLNQNSILFNGKQAQVTAMSERLVKMILDGENYNNSNQLDITTQRKSKIKKRLNSSGSLNKQPSQDQKSFRKKGDVKVSKFSPQEEIHHRRTTRKFKQIDESAEDYEEESEEAYSSQSNSQKINLRSKRRKMGNENKRQQHPNGRVTRSRTKH